MLITTRKFWNDRHYWNLDVVDSIGNFDLKYLNETENLVMRLLDFRMFVAPDEFNHTFAKLSEYLNQNKGH